MRAKNISIPLDTYHIQADLYLQENSSPLIVMAHGFGGDKSCALHLYIDFYIEQGYSVCCFDYRGFGNSTGKYKNLVDKNSQLLDWQTVIDYLKKTLNLTEKQLILWGYSLSGAHVLTLASKTNYQAVIANFPHVDGVASVLKYPSLYLLPAVFLAVTDLALSMVGRTKTMKVVSKNRFAVLSGKDSYEGYYSLIPPDQYWDNKVPARIIATISFYRPIAVAHYIQCPTLMLGAKNDSLIPIVQTRKTAQKSKYIQYVEENCGHFDLFHRQFMSTIQKQHSEFLESL